jgi:hypothetical protein
MKKLFDYSEYKIGGTRLTAYVGTSKGHLTDQNIFSKKSEALDSQAMLEHPKVI